MMAKLTLTDADLRKLCKDDASYEILLSHVQELRIDTGRESDVYQRLIELQTEMISRALPDTTIIWANEAYCQAAHLPRDEVIGKRFLDLVDNQPSRDLIAQSIERLSVDSPVQIMEGAHFRHGEELWEQWVERGIFDEDGNLLEILSVGRDITDRKRSEEQALQLELEHQRLHILTQFIRDSSHEFRTPLAKIKVDAYLAKRVDTDYRRNEYLDDILNTTDAILELIESLVLMVEVEELNTVEMEPVDINNLLDHIVMSLQPEMERRGIPIKFELEVDLPVISANRVRLFTALQKLIHNAVVYSRTDVSIDIRTYHEGNFVVVEIEDYGIGIPEAEQKRVFERLYRVDKSRTHRGFGLGLPIAKSIINLHEGTIELNSEPGKGTLVRVCLPT